VGQDIARLNIGSGWNIHVGTTAGTLETRGNIVGGNTASGFAAGSFSSVTEAPFVGTYVVATKGNFFIDGLVRFNYFETNLDSPSANLYNQKLDAHGLSGAFSTGYNYKLPNSNWFVEPSLGVVMSRVSVDPLNTASPVPIGGGFGNFSGTTQVNDIDSMIGRIGARVGTTLETKSMVLQPFVAASVWHEFADYVTSNYSSLPNGFFVAGFSSSLGAHMTTNNIGTFGQYSVGLSGQLINTGWLGFVRVDYREGPQMVGLSGTGGIRYQFTPVDTAAAMPVKAPAYTAPQYVNWAGLYVGAIGGAQTGRGSTYFPLEGGTDMRPAGALGGGTLGYNYQAGSWVYGFEADAAWTNAQGSAECAPISTPLIPTNTPLFQTTCHDDLNWTATAAARVGYTWTPRTLLYAKAGAAFAGESFSETCNLGPVNGFNVGGFGQNCVNSKMVFINTANASTTAVGWTLGYGAEFAFTRNWSAKAEFDWLDFGHKGLTLSDGTPITTYQRAAQTKVGVNYKF
jgi:opacity protein-like surface antigen